MLTMALNAYAWVICRLIWLVTWLAKPWRDTEAVEPLVPNIAYRDWEWFQPHRCASCKQKTLHRFVEWIEGAERVTTAECNACGHEETLS